MPTKSAACKSKSHALQWQKELSRICECHRSLVTSKKLFCLMHVKQMAASQSRTMQNGGSHVVIIILSECMFTIGVGRLSEQNGLV